MNDKKKGYQQTTYEIYLHISANMSHTQQNHQIMKT